VAELGQAALRGGPIENLIEQIPAAVAEALAVPHCHLIRFDPGAIRTTVSSTGDPASLFPGDVGCPVCTDAVERGRPALWERDADWSAELHATGPDCSAAAAVPVVPAGGPAGTLAVCTPDPEGFGPSDIAFLETVASILAAALTRRNVEEQLRRQAVHDGLTDLPNRALLKDRLETALSRMRRQGGRVAVLFVDLDNFKLINDSLGHSLGDSVVSAIAGRLRETVRAADTVARFGGDEFVVVSEDDDEASARQLGERLRQAVTAPLEMAGKTITVTASIGCASTADPGTSPDSLMADADMAMYEAKRGGKDGVAVFTPELRRRTTEHLETVSGIRRALDSGEFRLHYQSITDLATGQVAAHEALLRWERPTAGLLPPSQFIDYAETSELILPLGRWVLATGCAQSAAWRRAGQTAKVTMNVSGRQLTGGDIAADVSAALDQSGADPSDIYLEVTESAFMSNLEPARTALHALHDLGIRLGLDDFGTGWSSLSQLVRLPFDFVKIDRSFVRDLDRDPRTAALLGSITSLCSTLGLRVVVEGVETETQLERLKQLDVDYVQGFLIGRPVPAEELGAPG
jgi:diguanylate cyclase (GGDEF)-like protein